MASSSLQKIASKRAVFFVLLTVLLFVTSRGFAQESQSVDNYCPYFQNRAPSPQPDLQNCTWYKSNACCLSKELQIIFDNVPPPAGASPKCLHFLNRLMCFVCAPDQNLFYRNERLTVCSQFCEDLFSACGTAILKGTQIKSLYYSGRQFCLARKFHVKNEDSGKCFMPNMAVESSAFSPRVEVFVVVTLQLTSLMLILT